jgi:hypothetical protein
MYNGYLSLEFGALVNNSITITLDREIEHNWFRTHIHLILVNGVLQNIFAMN